MKTLRFRILEVWVMLGALSGCQNQQQFLINEQFADSALRSIHCEDPKNLLLDNYKLLLLDDQLIPEADYVVEKTMKSLTAKNPKMTQVKKERIKDLMQKWITHIEQAYLRNEKLSKLEKIEALSSYDVEDRSNIQIASHLSQKVSLYSSLQQELKTLDLDCSSVGGETQAGNPLLSNPEEDLSLPSGAFATSFTPEKAKLKNKALEAYGALAVMATTYQTCDAVERRILDRNTPPLEGIAITGKHSNGVGLKRSMASLTRLQQTHPYLDKETARRSQCFNTFDQPPIYDYGGKPFVDGPLRERLNLHRNAGSGTEVLGIDCSGLVFSALATMGLKIKKDRELKALDVYSWNARSYMEPKTSGMSCLSKITSTQDVFQSGLIFANSGHIVIIDEVARDPFSLAKLKGVQDCANLKSSAFQFSIIQSSNSKNGVGVNRFHAADFFTAGNSMTAGLLNYARAYCRAHFSKQVQSISSSEASLVRHRREDPSCHTRRIAMANESCVAQCSVF